MPRPRSSRPIDVIWRIDPDHPPRRADAAHALPIAASPHRATPGIGLFPAPGNEAALRSLARRLARSARIARLLDHATG